MSNAFVFSSLLSAILSLGLAGFATARFITQSEDCQDGATTCVGQSMHRGHKAVKEVVNGIERNNVGPGLPSSGEESGEQEGSSPLP
jgi:hypothetical protein